jgi:hypothetical protein
MILIYPAYLNAPDSDTLAAELNREMKTINTFVFQTMDDSYVSSAFALANALRGTQANLELHILPKGGHGYGMTSGNLAAETWPVLAADWLKKQ